MPGLPVIECLLEAAVRDLYQMKRSGAGAGSMRIGENPQYPRSLSYSELIQFTPRLCRPQSARIARMITHTNESLSC
jgi:hypothetical protein